MTYNTEIYNLRSEVTSLQTIIALLTDQLTAMTGVANDRHATIETLRNENNTLWRERREANGWPG